MGLKHLRIIEALMKEHSDKSYSKTEIRDTLRIDYQTVLDTLAYFLDDGKVVKSHKIGEVEKFKWVVS